MKALVPGSYDPVTLGHIDIIRRAAEQYSEVYAVIFVNPEKSYTFSKEERLRMLTLATEDIPNVTVDFSDGFVVDYMRKNALDKIVKGYRTQRDLEYERAQAEYNFSHGGFETELLLSDPQLAEVSSTLARERIAKGESLEGILPKKVVNYLKNEKSNN